MYINLPQINLTYLILHQFTSMYSMPLKVWTGSWFQSILVMCLLPVPLLCIRVLDWPDENLNQNNEKENFETFNKISILQEDLKAQLKSRAFLFGTEQMICQKKSVGVDGRGLGWHEVGMDPNWWKFIPIISQNPND